MIELLADPRRKYGPPEHLHRVVPGFTRADLARLFAEKGFTRGAEIGVADGRYSLTLCQTIPNLQLLCVDPWQPYHDNRRGGPREQHERNYQLAQERLRAFDVTFSRAKSTEAVQAVPLGSLDFVYVDANHAYEYVLADITEWAKRVRIGCIVAGHDMYRFKGAGVVEAVEFYTGAHSINDWHMTDEREPSFWWVKS